MLVPYQFENESFEQIMVINVFEHVINLNNAVDAVIRKFKVGWGHLLFLFPLMIIQNFLEKHLIKI